MLKFWCIFIWRFINTWILGTDLIFFFLGGGDGGIGFREDMCCAEVVFMIYLGFLRHHDQFFAQNFIKLWFYYVYLCYKSYSVQKDRPNQGPGM